MKSLGLFAGIGGLELAAESAGIHPLAFSELDDYPSQILKRHWPNVPNLGDVSAITGSEIDRPDFIIGGFPCQDLSNAGRQKGLHDEQGNYTRSGLFFHIIRLAGVLQPRVIFMENVAGLLTAQRGSSVRTVFGALAEVGFDSVWGTVRASDIGSPHGRERVWICAYRPGVIDGARLLGTVRSRLTGYHGETWPTPTASDAWASTMDRSGIVGKHNLGLGTAVRMWPTPDCQNFRSGRTLRAESNIEAGGKHGVSLHHAVEYGLEPEEGYLNPDWVESLMGYPAGYTLPEGEPNRTLPRQWPAPMGAAQFDWEPERLAPLDIPFRKPRLKGLGNAVVPEVPEIWFRAIMEQVG